MSRESWTTEWKTLQFKKLHHEWKDCERCGLCKVRNNIVFGNGYPNADVMFIGEAPGEHEDKSGHAFIGPSGKLLYDMIEVAGLNPKGVFATNILMCRPPENRDPMKTEREACLERLHRQIYVVDPMVIVPVGKIAMKALMGGKYTSIVKSRGKLGQVKIHGWREELVYDAIPILHPSYILREDAFNKQTKKWTEDGEAMKTVNDLKMVKAVVDFLKNEYRKVENSLRR